MRQALGLVLLLSSGCAPPPAPEPDGALPSHVLFLHLDGYRGDLTQSLLESGRLPYLEALVKRGRVSFEATTVDKSETMKVVQSYLTSQLDTEVAGWWQFDRSDFRFRNFWLDPGEVVSFALGLRFPRSPTIQDFLAARGENLVASMSLARRGVPFQNYGRAYLEGVEAVGAHTYHKQARATTDAFLSIHRRIAEKGEPSPRLSTLLLAAADEFSHLDGVLSEAAAEPRGCFDREELDDTIFARLDEAPELEARYFASVDRTLLTRKSRSLCIDLPEIRLENGSTRRAHPSYVLSKIVLDIEIGRVVELLRSIRWSGDDGPRRIEAPASSLLESGDPVPGSLFDRTLFLVFGDHGMVDTPRGMTGDDGFIQYLDRSLELTTDGEELGIDYWNLPERLADPAAHPEWQSEEVRAIVADAEGKSRALFDEVTGVVRDGLHESYWWLFFLRSLWIDPKLDAAVEPVSADALSVLRGLYLRASRPYVEAEEAASRAFYDRSVKLVYGGGARNNAELFLPSCPEAEPCSWRRRPTYEQILGYRGGSLLEALEAQPAVGLIFVRRNNERFAHDAALPESLEIEVRDREGRRAVIRVARAEGSNELDFHYRTRPDSPGDPLGYERWGAGAGTSGSYNEWIDRTVGETYVNAVGGVGTYLYSRSPSIGDVLLMHAPGWNFGENKGGHGGLERGEKTTFMLASGSEIPPGELRSKGGHVPTLLDLVPTALDFLGYSEEEFDDFARDGFRSYLNDWIGAQRESILTNLDGSESLERAKEEAGLAQLSFETLEPKLWDLLAFVESEREATLERAEARPLLGTPLDLR